VTETQGIEGLVLRYGYLYGPRTSYAPGAPIAERVRRRRLPVVGAGTGVWSFVHVEDAAAATALAVTRGRPGIYNVVDDEPARVSEWLSAYADALGAKPPPRVPAFVGRVGAGRGGVDVMTNARGASNEKARRELGWKPRYPSWRTGFRVELSRAS
jgi:nucleoside-diphosphate-sugar epimerase